MPPIAGDAYEHNQQNDDKEDDVEQVVADIAESLLREPFLERHAGVLVHHELRDKTVVEQQRDDEQHQPANHIDGALEDDRAERLVEGDFLVTLQERAAEDFAKAGQGEVGEIANHDGIKHHGEAGTVVDRLKQKPCSCRTDEVGRHNRHHRQGDEQPSPRSVHQRHRREDHLNIILA